MQRDIVHTNSDRMGWPVRPLDDGDGALVDGRVADVEVQAIAMPLGPTRSGGHDALARPRTVTTAAHAELLRALIDWAASLPIQVQALEVGERIEEEGGALAVRLTVPDHADVAAVHDQVIVPIDNDGWGGLRGVGVLPIGHDLTITVGRP